MKLCLEFWLVPCSWNVEDGTNTAVITNSGLSRLEDYYHFPGEE